MLSPFLLVGASISSVIGSYYYLQRMKLQKLFETIEKAELIDFDHVINKHHLPLNKTIALSAEVDTEDLSQKTSKYNLKEKIIFSEVKKILPRDKQVTKQSLNDENEHLDALYHSIKNDNLPGLVLKNKMQETIEIHWPKVKEIGLFGIKSIVEKIDPAEIPDVPNEDFLEKIKFYLPGQERLEDGEFGLLPEEKYIYIGELYDPATRYNKTRCRLAFEPKYILGDSKDCFLKYIDGQIIQSEKRTKIAFSTAVVFGLGQIAKFVFFRYKKRNPFL